MVREYYTSFGNTYTNHLKVPQIDATKTLVEVIMHYNLNKKTETGVIDTDKNQDDEA